MRLIMRTILTASRDTPRLRTGMRMVSASVVCIACALTLRVQDVFHLSPNGSLPTASTHDAQSKTMSSSIESASDKKFAMSDDYSPNKKKQNDDDTIHLQSCRGLMLSGDLPSNGDFLTATPYQWQPLADGSFTFLLNEACQLYRYTSRQARQCLANKHLHMMGDSLTRFQFLSLVHFLRLDEYPTRFGMERSSDCVHINEAGNPTCSTPQTRNVAMVEDFRGWAPFHQAIGGQHDGGPFQGHLECNCARDRVACPEGIRNCDIENFLYADPGDNITLSFVFESGWGDYPSPIKGLAFSTCAYEGTCRRKELYPANITDRASRLDYDWFQNLTDALSPDGGALRKHFPPIDISIYNRGLWGTLTAPRARAVLPLFKDLVNKRCFFKSTTANGRSTHWSDIEPQVIKPITEEAGCSYLDWGFVTQEFAKLWVDRKTTNETLLQSRNNVFVDSVHFQPWMNEELNNLLLNVLCNAVEL